METTKAGGQDRNESAADTRGCNEHDDLACVGVCGGPFQGLVIRTEARPLPWMANIHGSCGGLYCSRTFDRFETARSWAQGRVNNLNTVAEHVGAFGVEEVTGDHPLVEWHPARRIYIAARYGRRAQANALRVVLERIGHVVTARWVTGDHQGAEDARAALEDIQDLDAADTLVALSETGEVPGQARGGRHVEFGYALAQGKRVIVLGPRENVFHHLPGVEVVANVDDLVRALAAVGKAVG
jgi:hypothetical protein